MAAVLCGGALWYVAPGAEENCKATALSETKQKCTFPAPNSIEFGVGKVHFGTERDNRHPKQNCQAFPLVLRVKNQRIAAGKQPKKLTSVSPLQGF